MNNSPDLEKKKLDSIETLDANEYLSVSQFKNMKESITQAKTNEEIDSILEQANYFGLINHRDELIEELRQRQLEEEQIRDFEAKLRLATSHEELEKVFSLVLEQEHDNLKNPEFVSKARFASTKDSQPNVQKEDEKAVDFETNRQLYINNVKEFTHLADNVKEEYISKLVGCNSLDELRMIYNEVSELNDFGMDDIDLAADINEIFDNSSSRQERLEALNPEPSPTDTLDSIIMKLTNGIVLDTEDDMEFIANNVKVLKDFAEKVRRENYSFMLNYQISRLHSPVINLTTKIRELIVDPTGNNALAEKISVRLDKLSDAEMMILLEEYNGKYADTCHISPMVDYLINERLRVFIIDNIGRCNEQLVQLYANVYKDVAEATIYAKYGDANKVSGYDNASSGNLLANTLDGKIDVINQIRQLQFELNSFWLKCAYSRGLDQHDVFGEAVLLSQMPRPNCPPGETNDFLAEKAKSKSIELEGVNNNDNIEALIGFLRYEDLLIRNLDPEFMDSIKEGPKTAYERIVAMKLFIHDQRLIEALNDYYNNKKNDKGLGM